MKKILAYVVFFLALLITVLFIVTNALANPLQSGELAAAFPYPDGASAVATIEGNYLSLEYYDAEDRYGPADTFALPSRPDGGKFNTCGNTLHAWLTWNDGRIEHYRLTLPKSYPCYPTEQNYLPSVSR